MSDVESFYVDIRCVDLVELVTDYLDGALSAADLRRFDDHVEDCDACRVYIDQIKMTVTLAGAVERPDIELPGNFEELVHLFTNHRS
jgi:anti-sigma factor RsiW